MQTFDRQALAQALSDIPTGQFEQVAFVLQIPHGILPGPQTPQAERATALLKWAETSGSGLNEVQATIDEILGDFLERAYPRSILRQSSLSAMSQL